MNSKQNTNKVSASELLKKGKTIVWEKSNNLYMPRYYKAIENEVYYTDGDLLNWRKSSSELKDFENSFDYVTKQDFLQ